MDWHNPSYLLPYEIFIEDSSLPVREAAKKIKAILVVGRPLRGGGGYKRLATKKIAF